MSYPTQTEMLSAEPLLGWIDQRYLRSDPYAFSAKGFWPIVERVSAELGIDANGIYCVGSGAIGLSINPDKVQGSSLKPFDRDSDIDLAFISEVQFETAWRDLREHSQASLPSLDADLEEKLKHQRSRFFDGIILTNRLLSALSYGPDWLTAQVRISELVANQLDREIEVNYWIYRDYWSLRNYVSKGIIRCRGKVRAA